MGEQSTHSLTTTFLAWFGALVSFALAVLRILEFRRDRANVVVTYAPGYEILNSPDYDPHKTYALVTVANQGRRPVTIKTIAALPKSKKDKAMILLDSFRLGPRELSEGKSTDYVFEQDQVDFAKLKYIVAYDMTGKQYRCRVRPKETAPEEARG